MRELNIISPLTRVSDIDPIFTPARHEEFLPIGMFKDMADIWVFAGMFPSRSQAIKNNHGGNIPVGFTDVIKKKRNLRITIWNPED